MTESRASAVGTPTARVDGPAKVTGTATYAYEHPLPDPVHLHPVLSTVARGTVSGMDTDAAEQVEGVLAVLTPFNAPRLADTSDAELSVLQGPAVHFRGQIVGAVIATTPEAARHAQSLVRVEYATQEHDAGFRADHPGAYDAKGATSDGDVESELAAAEVLVDEWYSTPEEHNNPMEPHTAVAVWDPHAPLMTLYSSTQGPHVVVRTLAPILGLEPDQLRVVAPHVGGGFGSKGSPHAHDVLAALGARALPGRAVKYAVTRQQGFVFVGYRSPTRQRVRLGARADGTLTAVDHASWSQVSPAGRFPEAAASASATMYAGTARRTAHRLVPLDVPPPYWMRAPGKAPGVYALEVAMDELATACGIDPVELRVRNDPPTDPATGNEWTSRRLVDCLHEGARLFGWEGRDPRPGVRREGEWLVGTGMASATYPHVMMPGTQVTVRHDGGGRYTVQTAAADLGTGTWTTLSLIAADALGVPTEAVSMEIGDSALPAATVAGGSSGTSSWGAALVSAARAFRDEHGTDPGAGAQVTAGAEKSDALEGWTAQSFGAHFVQVRVNAGTGEVRVPRMRSVFSIGRVINPRTVRSQFLGGMVMGVSMALHERSVRDPRFGHVVTQDLATYHVPVHADIEDIDATWLDEVDERATPMGSRGAGEIGIVGAAAAVVNAVHHATGVRVRDLPLTPATLVGR